MPSAELERQLSRCWGRGIMGADYADCAQCPGRIMKTVQARCARRLQGVAWPGSMTPRHAASHELLHRCPGTTVEPDPDRPEGEELRASLAVVDAWRLSASLAYGPGATSAEFLGRFQNFAKDQLLVQPLGAALFQEPLRRARQKQCRMVLFNLLPSALPVALIFVQALNTGSTVYRSVLMFDILMSLNSWPSLAHVQA